MTANAGMIDRALRVIVGLALIAWTLNLIPGFPGQVWGWIGVVPVLTAALGFCPLYTVLGFSTCPVKAK